MKKVIGLCGYCKMEIIEGSTVVALKESILSRRDEIPEINVSIECADSSFIYYKVYHIQCYRNVKIK